MNELHSSGKGALSAASIRAEQLTFLARTTATNSAATAVNALLVGLVLSLSVERWRVAIWVGLQVVPALWVWWRWRQRAPRTPQGSVRGLRRAAVLASIAGLCWGSSVFLLESASSVQRLVVITCTVAMAAGAAATLATVPAAARGYVVGALAPLVLDALRHLSLEWLVLAVTAVVFLLYLLRTAALNYDSFIAEAQLRRDTENAADEFRRERAEWLDLSQGTESFALFSSDLRLLLWNAHFQNCITGDPLTRGLSLDELLEDAPVPLAIDGVAVDKAGWMSRCKARFAEGGAHLEEHAEDRWSRMTVTRTPSGRIVVLKVDLTEFKRAERTVAERDQSLAHAQRLETLGELAGGVAHDFNNTLTAILGFTDLLAFEVKTDSAQELLEEIRSYVARGATLTRQLLAYGRRQMLRPVPFQLNELISRLQPLVKSSLHPGIDLELELDDGLLPCRADPAQVEQVLLNLILNARDSLGETGALALATSNRSDGMVEVSVADTGRGIKAEHLDKIFEPFFSTKSASRGTGLGLSVSLGVIKQSGGTIEVESREGMGSIFRVRLPVTQAKPQSLEVQVEDRVLSDSAEHVLVVDDEPGVLSAVANMLRGLGYSVTEAGGPCAALDLLGATPSAFDLLLSDVTMPDMDGLELAKRAALLAPTMRVVFMTAYDSRRLGQQTDFEVLDKPFGGVALSRTLQRTFESPHVLSNLIDG